MQAIEFETTAQNHIIHLPDSIPDGVNLRVLVLLEDNLDFAKEEPTSLTVKSAFGLVKTPITASLAEIEQSIVAGAASDNH